MNAISFHTFFMPRNVIFLCFVSTFDLRQSTKRMPVPARPPALFARLFNPPHTAFHLWIGEILQMYVISPERVYTLDEKKKSQFLGGPFISLVPHTDRLLSEISRQVPPLSCRLSSISFVKSFHTFLRQKTSLFLPSRSPFTSRFCLLNDKESPEFRNKV